VKLVGRSFVVVNNHISGISPRNETDSMQITGAGLGMWYAQCRKFVWLYRMFRSNSHRLNDMAVYFHQGVLPAAEVTVSELDALETEFYEILARHDSEAEKAGLALIKAFGEACSRAARRLQEANAHLQPKGSPEQRTLDAVKVERNTWHLLHELLEDRATGAEEGPGHMRTDQAKFMRSNHAMNEHLYRADREYREMFIVLRWLERAYRDDYFIESTDKGVDPATGKRITLYSDRLYYEESRRRALGGSLGLGLGLGELDPDAQLRGAGGGVDATDGEAERQMFREVFRLVRCGLVSDAQEVCLESGHAWAAAALEGIRPYHNYDFDSNPDEPRNIVGDMDPSLWRETCATLAVCVAMVIQAQRAHYTREAPTNIRDAPCSGKAGRTSLREPCLACWVATWTRRRGNGAVTRSRTSCGASLRSTATTRRWRTSRPRRRACPSTACPTAPTTPPPPTDRVRHGRAAPHSLAWRSSTHPTPSCGRGSETYVRLFSSLLAAWHGMHRPGTGRIQAGYRLGSNGVRHKRLAAHRAACIQHPSQHHCRCDPGRHRPHVGHCPRERRPRRGDGAPASAPRCVCVATPALPRCKVRPQPSPGGATPWTLA
jgi:hypothetical protein